MAFASLSDAWATWFLANRYGPAPAGTAGSCLVSDLAVGDFMCGSRQTIIAVGAVSGSNKSFTVERADVQTTVSLPTASSLRIIRP